MNKLKGLFVFSITNMLERFGFYCMMAILVFSFMEEGGYSGKEAGTYYSIFYSAIFLSMLIMGIVGDFVNRKKIIFIGMIAMAIGYFLYSILSKGNGMSLLIPGLFLVLGVGAFKVNLQVRVGDLYKSKVKNGALGYLIFYSFINLGAIFAPFAAIYFRDTYGVDSVFLLSAAATVLALTLYYFVPISTEVDDESTKKSLDKANANLNAPINENTASTKYGLDKLIGIIFLILVVPVFWMAFHQNGLVYTMYVYDYITPTLNGPEIIQSINPIANVLLSILLFVFMYFFAKMKRIHSIFPYIGIGMLIVAIGYFIPFYGIANISGKLPYSYAIIPMIVITIGELFISPFLILAFYHFSPAKLKGLFMGIFMAVSAVGNLLLFKYAMAYETYGAASTFKKIVIHVLITAAAVFLVWLIIKRLSMLRKKEEGSQIE